MEIALINNGNVTQVGNYGDLFPNTSFLTSGPSDEFLNENNAKKVSRFKSYDSLTQQLTQATPYIEGEWVYVVSVIELTPEQIQFAKDSAMANIKSTRNRLLASCDWTQMPDVDFTKKTLWATYRQTLRDLPSTITDPRTFTEWPHNPDWVERTI